MYLRWTLSIALPLFLLPACGGHAGGTAVPPPSALEFADSSPLFMVDAPHAALTPSVAGKVRDWSITPSLPSGLALDPLTGEISGTPQASALRQTYTVKASNTAGSTETTIEFAVEKPERYAYVTNSSDRTITILGLDDADGAVRRRGFVVGQDSEGHPESFTPNPRTAFGYSTSSEGVLTTWAIDAASGWLTELDALDVGVGPHALTVAPDGHYVLVSRKSWNSVWVYEASPETGLLRGPVSMIGVGPQPTALALDPTGTLLVVTDAGDPTSGVGSDMLLHTFDPGSGALAPLGSMRLNGLKPAQCAFAARQDVIYVSFPQFGRLIPIAFDRQSGHLVSLGSVVSGAGCAAFAIDPLGGRVWAANDVDSTLTCFAIQPSGALSSLGAVRTNISAVALAMDPLGRFLFALDSTARELGLFDLDLQSRALTLRASWLMRDQPVHVSFGRGEHALHASSSELLVTAFDSSEVLVHSVDPATGALGDGVSVPSDNGPSSVAVDPRQRFAFTSNSRDNSIGRYRIDPETGALSELQPAQSVEGVPVRVVADGSGRFVYVAARVVTVTGSAGFVDTYAIDPSTAELTLQSSVASDFAPTWLGTDPTGQFLYVTNSDAGASGSAAISTFRVAADTGLLTDALLSPPTSAVWSLGFHPSGRYVYAALRTTNVALPFKIDKTDGSLSLTDSGVIAQPEPMSVSVTPDGRRAYVAYRNGGGVGSIGVCEIDPATGVLLAPTAPFLDGIAPVDLCIDPSGRFLYSANSGTDSISAFSIEDADGYLLPLIPVATGLSPSALVLLQRWQ